MAGTPQELPADHLTGLLQGSEASGAGILGASGFVDAGQVGLCAAFLFSEGRSHRLGPLRPPGWGLHTVRAHRRNLSPPPATCPCWQGRGRASGGERRSPLPQVGGAQEARG